MRTFLSLSAIVLLAVGACSDDETQTGGSGGTSTSSSTTAATGGGNQGGGGQGGAGSGGFAMNDDCGNGVLDAAETCDDGNDLGDDGCSATCVIECGFLCLSLGSPCIAGFHGVQCASPGAPFGQASPIANDCQAATLSLDGTHIELGVATTMGGLPRHLDAIFTDGQNRLFGFAGNTEDIAAGSRLVSVDPTSGIMTPVGPELNLWVMGAAMNDAGELWVTLFDTYESNATTEVRIAQVSPQAGTLLSGPTQLTNNGQPVTVWSIHVSDVAFRNDDAMFISANQPGPLPPEPLSLYYEVDPTTATVLSTTEGPDDLYAAGIVFVGDQQQILAMDIRGEDDIFLLDLSMPPSLNQSLLYPDPIPTNSGTADLAGCAKLPAPMPL